MQCRSPSNSPLRTHTLFDASSRCNGLQAQYLTLRADDVARNKDFQAQRLLERTEGKKKRTLTSARMLLKVRSAVQYLRHGGNAVWGTHLCRTAQALQKPLANKLEVLLVINQTCLEGSAQEASDRFAPTLAVIQSPMVDVHTDEFVSQVFSHIAREL